MLRFWTAAAGYHVVLCALGAFLCDGVRRRIATGRRPEHPLVELVAFALAVPFLAAVATLFGPGPIAGFGLLRLVSQALFGETIVLCLALTFLYRRGARRWPIVLSAAAALLLAVYWEAYHREPRDLQVSRHDVDLAGGAAGSSGLRIVHLTDLQTHHIGAYEDHAIREALAQEPDLIVMTGDYIQPRLEPTRARATADLKRLLRERRIRAPLGVFAVRGDVDLDWPGVFDGTGVTPLTGEIVRLPLSGGRMLSLVGLTIRMSRGQEDEPMMQLVGRVPPGDLSVVIGHNPNFVQTLAARHAPVDLALAGHTHGGQVVLPLLGAPITKMRLPARYASGLAAYEGIPLHVSRGIGMERGAAPQIRFLCPPEICVLNVRYGGRAVARY
jgi:predicted MPP superfamily phosphohydrolase